MGCPGANAGSQWAELGFQAVSARGCPAGRQGPGVFKVGAGLIGVGGDWSPGGSEGSASSLVGEAVFCPRTEPVPSNGALWGP